MSGWARRTARSGTTTPRSTAARTGALGVSDPAFTGFYRLSTAVAWAGRPAAGWPGLHAGPRRPGTAPVLAGHGGELLDLGLRTHEILENALEFQLTGHDDYGSGTTLATTAANISGTWELLGILRPLLVARDPGLPSAYAWLHSWAACSWPSSIPVATGRRWARWALPAGADRRRRRPAPGGTRPDRRHHRAAEVMMPAPANQLKERLWLRPCAQRSPLGTAPAERARAGRRPGQRGRVLVPGPAGPPRVPARRARRGGHRRGRGVLAGAGAGTPTARPGPRRRANSTPRAGGPPARGSVPRLHQAGILPKPQRQTVMLSFNVTAGGPGRADRPAAYLRPGPAPHPGGTPPEVGIGGPPPVSGVLGPTVVPDGLIVTRAGATLFDDRYGLAARKPAGLTPMTAFPNDDLDPAQCGGDLSLQLSAGSQDTSCTRSGISPSTPGAACRRCGGSTGSPARPARPAPPPATCWASWTASPTPTPAGPRP